MVFLVHHSLSLLLFVVFLFSIVATPVPSLPSIVLNASTAHHVYQGIGALSAGASSRMLYDYPEPYRSDILDFLFKPSFGASLHVLKVEIPGDVQSTDGSEPSHMHTRDDLNCYRGYEWWLIKEAKQRNPSIYTYALSWGVPYWVGSNNTGGFHSPDNWYYQLRWLECIRNVTGVTVDYIGDWNEKPMGPPSYVKGLRSTLDSNGFNGTLISLMDNDYSLNNLIAQAVADNEFNASFYSVGRHYPCDYAGPAIESVLHKPYWSSEDGSLPNDWLGSSCWAQLLNRNYVLMNITSTIAWSLIWATPPGLPFANNGLLTAQEPWSGYYYGGTTGGTDPLNGPLFTTAMTTQFVQPGWQYLLVNQSGSGLLSPVYGNGSYVTLINPGNLSAFTIIIEKIVGPCKCASPGTGNTTDAIVPFTLTGGLSGPGTVIHVWRTNETHQFWPDNDITIADDNTFSIWVPRDSIVTLSTVSTAHHGQPANPIPSSSSFPLPYTDNFDTYPEDTTPVRYFADETGSFAVRSGALTQVVPIDPGSNRWVQEDVDPFTLIGDNSLQNILINVSTIFQPSTNTSGPGAGSFGFTYTQVCGRIANYTGLRNGPPNGYCLALNVTGAWLLRAGTTVLVDGQLPNSFNAMVPSTYILSFTDAEIVGWILPMNSNDSHRHHGTGDGTSSFDSLPTPLFNITSTHYPYGGLVGIGSGFHYAAFDNFTLSASS